MRSFKRSVILAINLNKNHHMKKLLLTFSLAIISFSYAFAQLDSVYFLNLPCNSYVGVTSVIGVNPDTNALYYEWSVDSGMPLNAILFNGAPSPVQTTIPEVTLTFPLQLQYYAICVTAFSACCTSNTYCDTLSGEVPLPVLSGTNSTLAVPGDSGIYSVEQLVCPPAQLVWTISGNASFNNGGQTIITPLPDTSININFGPAFTTGNLCVKGVTDFGLSGDSVCMTVIAFVGLDANDEVLTSFYYQPDYNQVSFNYTKSIQEEVSINLYDIAGRLITSRKVFLVPDNQNATIPLPDLNQGIYMVEISSRDFSRTLKFAKTN